MKKYIFVVVLALLVFLMLFIINWHKNQLTKEIKSVGTVSNEIKSPESFEIEVDTLDNIRKLYESFQESKYKAQDAEEYFYNSDFYKEFVNYLSDKESVNEDIAYIGSKISYNKGSIDLKGKTESFTFNGDKYNIRLICYTADYYVKNLTDSAMSNKNIYVQIYNNNEFYFYIICQREDNYVNDFKVIEYNGNIYIVILGSNGAYYPGSAFIGSLMWDGEKIYKVELLNLSENDDILFFRENNSDMWYTEKNISCHVNDFNWYNSFNYNSKIINKFAFYGRDDYAYVVRYNNTDNEFTDLTFVTAEFEGNNIVLSSESFDGVKTSVKLMFEDGKYINWFLRRGKIWKS